MTAKPLTKVQTELLDLIGEQGKASSATLARLRRAKHPNLSTYSSMTYRVLNRLKSRGLVQLVAYDMWSLTEQGQKA